MSLLVRIAAAKRDGAIFQQEQYIGEKGRPVFRRDEAMRFTALADAGVEADLWTNGTVFFECERGCCFYEVDAEGKPAHR